MLMILETRLIVELLIVNLSEKTLLLLLFVMLAIIYYLSSKVNSILKKKQKKSQNSCKCLLRKELRRARRGLLFHLPRKSRVYCIHSYYKGGFI